MRRLREVVAAARDRGRIGDCGDGVSVVLCDECDRPASRLHSLLQERTLCWACATGVMCVDDPRDVLLAMPCDYCHRQADFCCMVCERLLCGTHMVRMYSPGQGEDRLEFLFCPDCSLEALRTERLQVQ